VFGTRRSTDRLGDEGRSDADSRHVHAFQTLAVVTVMVVNVVATSGGGQSGMFSSRRGSMPMTRLDGATATTAAVSAPVPGSDVKDGGVIANSGEFHEERGECATPPAHEALVRVACKESVTTGACTLFA
jgi:hypothetical protein